MLCPCLPFLLLPLHTHAKFMRNAQEVQARGHRLLEHRPRIPVPSPSTTSQKSHVRPVRRFSIHCETGLLTTRGNFKQKEGTSRHECKASSSGYMYLKQSRLQRLLGFLLHWRGCLIHYFRAFFQSLGLRLHGIAGGRVSLNACFVRQRPTTVFRKGTLCFH